MLWEIKYIAALKSLTTLYKVGFLFFPFTWAVFEDVDLVEVEVVVGGAEDLRARGEQRAVVRDGAAAVVVRSRGAKGLLQRFQLVEKSLMKGSDPTDLRLRAALCNFDLL